MTDFLALLSLLAIVIALFMLSGIGDRLRRLEDKINWLGKFADRVNTKGAEISHKEASKPEAHSEHPPVRAAVLAQAAARPSVSVPSPHVPTATSVPHLSQGAHTAVTHEVHVPTPSPVPLAVPVPPPQYHAATAPVILNNMINSEQTGDIVNLSAKKNAQHPARAPKVIEYEDDPLVRFVAWLKEDFMLKLGGFFVLLGMLWLAKIAGADTPAMRVGAGMIVGVSLTIFGWLRMQKYFNQGSIFLVLGSTIFIGTTYLGRAAYPGQEMYSALIALALMFLSSAFVGFVSVAYKNKVLAVLSLFSALAVPMLAGGSQNFVGLFAYLLVTILGALVMIRFTRFRGLIVMAQTAVLLYSIPAIGSSDGSLILPLIYGFVAMFFLASLVPQIENRPMDDDEWLNEVVVSVLNVAMLLWWVIEKAPENWGGVNAQALVLTFWALVFATGGFLVARARREITPYLMQMIPAGLLIGIATYLQFGKQEELLTILWAGEVTVLMELLLLRAPRKASVVGWSALYVIPLIRVAGLYDAKFFDQIGTPTMALVAYVSTIGLIAMTSIRYIRALRAEGSIKQNEASIAHVWVGLALADALYGIWKFGHDLFNYQDLERGPGASAAIGFALTVYTIMGLPLLIRGRLHGDKAQWWSGVGLLTFVTAHLLLFDVWNMDPNGYARVLTFIAIGVLFMSTAFIGRMKKSENAE